MNLGWRKWLHSISPTNLRDTIRNRKFIYFRWVNNPVWLQRLLYFILFLALSVVNLTAWTSSTREITCEQFQVPCLVLFNNYKQADVSFSNLSIPECFQFCHAGIKESFPVPVFEDLPLSNSDTCKCSMGSRGQTPTLRGRLIDSLQRPICFTPTILVQYFCPAPVVFPKNKNSFRPPEHLKTLSSIVLIV